MITPLIAKRLVEVELVDDAFVEKRFVVVALFIMPRPAKKNDVVAFVVEAF